MKLSEKDLLALAPKANLKHLEHINATLEKWSINTPLRVAAFIAQCGHESFAWKTGENFGRLEEVADGNAYEGNKILGNSVKGDGKRFKGRGVIQLTGRFNYTAYSKYAKVDFLTNPERLTELKYAWDSAGWYWNWKGLNSFADAGNFTGLTKRINGGINGLEDREKRYLKALEYFKENGMA